MAEPQIDYAALAAEHGGSVRAVPPPPAGTWEDRGIGGQVWHPAIPPAAERVDRDAVGGIPIIGGISPEMVAAGGVGVARAAAAPAANLLGRAYAISKSAGEQVSPQIKYEVTKTGLQALGIPAPIAMAAALAVSGYRRGAKAAPAEAAPSGPHLDRSVPMRPGAMTQQQIGERLTFGTGTPPPKAGPKPMVGVSAAPPVEPVASGPVAPGPPSAAPPAPVASAPPPTAPPPTAGPPQSVPTPAANGLPDQRALNEAVLAVRRAAYQARLTMSAAPTNVKLSAAETKAFLDLMKRGVSGSDAMKNVLLQRELVGQLGTPTPTAAETRFPKGMRGKADPS